MLTNPSITTLTLPYLVWVTVERCVGGGTPDIIKKGYVLFVLILAKFNKQIFNEFHYIHSVKITLYAVYAKRPRLSNQFFPLTEEK